MRRHDDRGHAVPVAAVIAFAAGVTLSVLFSQFLPLLLDESDDLNSTWVQSSGICPGLVVGELDFSHGAIAGRGLLATCVGLSTCGGTWLTVVAVRAAEEFGEEARDKGFEGGQRGADDTDVHLDRGPVRCRSVVVGDVF